MREQRDRRALAYNGAHRHYTMPVVGGHEHTRVEHEQRKGEVPERAEAGELVEKGANLLVRVVLHRARQSHPEHATERYAKELQQVPGQVFHVVLPMPLW